MMSVKSDVDFLRLQMQHLTSGQDAILAALLGMQKPAGSVLNSPGTEPSSLTHTRNRRVGLNPERQGQCVSSIRRSLATQGVELTEVEVGISDHDRHWGQQPSSKAEGDCR
jgi:hypothetical protein